MGKSVRQELSEGFTRAFEDLTEQDRQRRMALQEACASGLGDPDDVEKPEPQNDQPLPGVRLP